MKLASKVFPSRPYLCSICPSDTAFLAFFNKIHPAFFFSFASLCNRAGKTNEIRCFSSWVLSSCSLRDQNFACRYMVLRLSYWCVPIGVMFFLGGAGGEGEGVTPASALAEGEHCSPCFPGPSSQARCLTWLNSPPSAPTLANWKRSSTSTRTSWRILSRNARRGIFSMDTTRFFRGRCLLHRSVLFKVSATTRRRKPESSSSV